MGPFQIIIVPCSSFIRKGCFWTLMDKEIECICMLMSHVLLPNIYATICTYHWISLKYVKSFTVHFKVFHLKYSRNLSIYLRKLLCFGCLAEDQNRSLPKHALRISWPSFFLELSVAQNDVQSKTWCILSLSMKKCHLSITSFQLRRMPWLQLNNTSIFYAFRIDQNIG